MKRTALVLLCGCTAADPQEDDSGSTAEETGTDETGSPPSAVNLGCADMPDAAEGATYSYVAMVLGATEPTFIANGLPPGLILDAATGEISGAPTTAVGSTSFELSVTSPEGDATATCQLSVLPHVAFDLEGCVGPGESALDFLIDGTGDGTPLTCSFVGGSGDGTIPRGINVGADCSIQGELMEIRQGTWVFVAEAEQSGAAFHIPFCATQPDPNYDIEVDGADQTIPIMGTFDPAADEVVFGGGGSPTIEVRDPVNCGDPCFFGFGFGLAASGFDTSSFDPMASRIDGGLTHGLHLSTTDLDDALRTRPWVATVTLDYCFDSVEDTCVGPDNVEENGLGGAVYSIVMIPS